MEGIIEKKDIKINTAIKITRVLTGFINLHHKRKLDLLNYKVNILRKYSI
jgi:hypothetical protein